MTNPFVKSVGQSASDMAKKIAKQVVQESFEVGKNIKDQVVGTENPSAANPNTPDSNVQNQAPQINEEEIHANDKIRLGDLQSEVQRLINERKQAYEDWKRNQDEMMKIGEKEEEDKRTLIQPTSKRKRGSQGPAKSKQGTKEISKSVSG
jgi:hypothetical protein